MACETAGCGGVTTILVQHHLHAVRREHLERGAPRGLGQGVRVDAEEQRAVDPGLGACRQIASETARICDSVKLRSSEEPRWPEVPKETRSAGIDGSGRAV
jgi:hypothetical protein